MGLGFWMTLGYLFCRTFSVLWFLLWMVTFVCQMECPLHYSNIENPPLAFPQNKKRLSSFGFLWVFLFFSAASAFLFLR
jgi:hypothetical protein